MRFFEDDQEHFASKWEGLITQKTTITLEVRIQTQWEGDIGGSVINIPRWILASVYPEVSKDGKLLSVMGCKWSLTMKSPRRVSAWLTAIGITEISRIKWAENLQIGRLHKAEETRRAQNSFIDITSHEMRIHLSKDTFAWWYFWIENPANLWWQALYHSVQMESLLLLRN